MKVSQRPAAKALAQARLQACRAWPYASSAIMSLSPVASEQVDIAAVDKHWRLYYRPKAIEACAASEVAAVILHEVAHLLLKHHKRAENVVPTYLWEKDGKGGREWILNPAAKAAKANAENAWQQWNVATDIAVNWLLPGNGSDLPEGCLDHKQFGFPEGLSAEQYYHLLMKKAEEQDEQDSDGEDGSPGGESDSGHGEDQSSETEDRGAGDSPDGTSQDGRPEAPETGDLGGESQSSDDGSQPGNGAEGSEDQGPGEGSGKPGTTPGQASGLDDDGSRSSGSGSCSDGRQRPWELDPDDTAGGAAPGLEDHEAEQIIRQCAEQAEKSQGHGFGHSQAFIDEVLHPKVDPRRLLMRAVQAHTENIVSGNGGRFTYRRPSRRPGIGGTIRPRSFRSVPRILVLIDTSGSMGQRDLALSVGLVGKVLSGLNLRDGVRVIAGDTYPQSDAQVFDPSKIELVGRGGTDMDALIEHAAELPKGERPELCIVCTDGYTGWPESSPGFPVVACITQDVSGYWEVPKWIDRVNLY